MCVADDAVSFDMKVDALFSWMRRIQNIQFFLLRPKDTIHQTPEKDFLYRLLL